MSLLGIGSAQIDLILPKDTYEVGEYIEGYFLIKGGTIDQQLRQIDCELIMREQLMGIKEIIDTQTILTSKRIESDEICKISFSFKLPNSISVSSEEISYCFKTKLSFDEGVESRDKDIIRII